MKTDSLFYLMFQALPQLFFDLIARPIDSAALYRFDSVEVKETAFRLDGVFQPPADQPTWPLFFVEVQFQLDADFYSRLFSEIFLYLRHHRPVHPWHAVALYPTRTLDPGTHQHYDVLLQSGHVTRVYLDEWVRPQQTVSQQLMGVVLAEPSRAVDEARTLLGQLRHASAIDTAVTAAIVNLIETIMVYKLPMVNREVLQKMLDLTEVDLKQTRFYQDVFSEGEQEGHQKGRQEGRQEEGVALILRQLQRRCGELAPAVREQVARLPLLQLEALGEALLDFRGLADLEQWLATQGQRGAES